MQAGRRPTKRVKATVFSSSRSLPTDRIAVDAPADQRHASVFERSVESCMKMMIRSCWTSLPVCWLAYCVTEPRATLPAMAREYVQSSDRAAAGGAHSSSRSRCILGILFFPKTIWPTNRSRRSSSITLSAVNTRPSCKEFRIRRPDELTRIWWNVRMAALFTPRGRLAAGRSLSRNMRPSNQPGSGCN